MSHSGSSSVMCMCSRAGLPRQGRQHQPAVLDPTSVATSCRPWCAGVELSNGTRVDAQVVLVNADPFRLRTLAGPEQFSADFNTWLDSLRKDGTTMKVCTGCVLGVYWV